MSRTVKGAYIDSGNAYTEGLKMNVCKLNCFWVIKVEIPDLSQQVWYRIIPCMMSYCNIFKIHNMRNGHGIQEHMKRKVCFSNQHIICAGSSLILTILRDAATNLNAIQPPKPHQTSPDLNRQATSQTTYPVHLLNLAKTPTELWKMGPTWFTMAHPPNATEESPGFPGGWG